MGVIDVRDAVVPASSSVRGACIGFSAMTVRLVALLTGTGRDGRRVVWFVVERPLHAVMKPLAE